MMKCHTCGTEPRREVQHRRINCPGCGANRPDQLDYWDKAQRTLRAQYRRDFINSMLRGGSDSVPLESIESWLTMLYGREEKIR